MGILKKLLFVVLVVVAVAGGLMVAVRRQLIPSQVLDQTFLSSLDLEKLAQSAPQQLGSAETLSSISNQTGVLAERAGQVGGQVQQVLGTAVKVNEADEDKNFSERAFEYGRYLYCQQVVEGWEKDTIY